MKIGSVKLVSFSPTGTTKAIAQHIAGGINPETIEQIDITRPEVRNQLLRTAKNELLIVAVPVYMGRVPALINGYLTAIKAQNTPTVCVVVYGNRAYENALLELKDIVSKCGCIPIAGAAYIGEHSFSNSETPSKGRPNEDDLDHAKEFGKLISKKLETISSISELSAVDVPGERPYGGITTLWNVDFIAVSDHCTQCGVCANVCPVEAVDSQNSSIINNEKCITCCACLKRCPQNARTMKPGLVKDAQQRVNTLFTEPKTPEYYL